MFENILRQDNRVVVSCLLLVSAFSWWYLFQGAGMSMNMPTMAGTDGGMSAMAATGIPVQAWSLDHSWAIFWMWWVMMVAMMLPSAAPMILFFAVANRNTTKGDAAFARVSTVYFAASYLFVWGLFSFMATGIQWGLSYQGLLGPMMDSKHTVFTAILLIGAGLYQFLPAKEACLRHCQTPLHFVMTQWRPGRLGAVQMGLIHGAYCLGCCWFLMLLLFYGGVMNLAWIGGLALYVLLEKTFAASHILGKTTGGLLILNGMAVLFI